MAKIIRNRSWNMFDVRNVCIEHDYYTRGSCEEYDRMLTRVSETVPDDDAMYEIAADIADHSGLDDFTREGAIQYLVVSGKDCHHNIQGKGGVREK